MAFVEVEGYSFAYPPAEGGATRLRAGVSDASCADERAWVVRDVGFQVEEGDFCVIVGATGCGKTTLLRSLKPELSPVGAREGSIRAAGRTLVEDGAVVQGFTPLESASTIGYVMQDPGAQIVCDTVWHELAFGLENLGVAQDEMRRRVAEVAHFFGIEPWVRSSVEELSGGQQQLVNLAAVLALRPRLLLLDEPTAQLDPNALKRFLFMLARVNRELGITVVMATHAPEDVAAYATRVVELQPLGAGASREEAEEKIAPRRKARREALAKADVAVEVRDAFVRYDRQAPWVLRGMDVRVRRGSVHALVGGNGCGKSTLLKLMAGILRPQRGSVKNALAGSQALMPQDPKALFVCDSVAEELHEWSARCGYGEDDEAEALRRFGLAQHASQHPYDLSGGQQQKLAFAKLLLTGAQLLFLDEPTKGLDPASCADASRIVRALADEGRTVVVVTHDLDFALVTADEVSMLFDGETACTEPAEEFFANNLVYRPNAHARLFGEV
ncbi:ABC transporter ATP-binding protein [Slackia faecicanis]|uniref:ABC transporter ATP-binding protein n=1 Tax=Slackia faecicanis TaxID=255723 RepID=UPI001FCEE233|nr:ATP-binding cassette domain-containing protein [Slackia faecicanis]